jgi:hypothetical protein
MDLPSTRQFLPASEEDRSQVYLVCLVCLVERNEPDEPNQADQPLSLVPPVSLVSRSHEWSKPCTSSSRTVI